MWANLIAEDGQDGENLDNGDFVEDGPDDTGLNDGRSEEDPKPMDRDLERLLEAAMADQETEEEREPEDDE